MTNFEYIKAMTIEDFFNMIERPVAVADIKRLINRYCDCDNCPAIEEDCTSDCGTVVAKWLKKEVKYDR